MKISVFGLTITSSWGNGHATLWRGLCRELGRMGHRVAFFERDVPYYAGHRDLLEPEGCELHLYRSWPEVEATAAAEVASADVGIITSYCPDAVAAADLVAGSPACLSVFYDLDAPVTLASVAKCLASTTFPHERQLHFPR